MRCASTSTSRPTTRAPNPDPNPDPNPQRFNNQADNPCALLSLEHPTSYPSLSLSPPLPLTLTPTLTLTRCALLTQEHAKKFLHQGNEEDRYRFFLQAANLETRKHDLYMTKSNVDELKSRLERAKVALFLTRILTLTPTSTSSSRAASVRRSCLRRRRPSRSGRRRSSRLTFNPTPTLT